MLTCSELRQHQTNIMTKQGGRTWQPFVGGKNGHENFRQVRIYTFPDKCVVFARNCKFANLTQYNMQYIACNNSLGLKFSSESKLFGESPPRFNLVHYIYHKR